VCAITYKTFNCRFIFIYIYIYIFFFFLYLFNLTLIYIYFEYICISTNGTLSSQLGGVPEMEEQQKPSRRETLDDWHSYFARFLECQQTGNN
jgi:hypothetical protein